MKRFLPCAALLIAALSLSACRVTVNPPDDGGITADVTAGLDRNDPVVSAESLPDGTSRLYRVAVPAGVADEDVLYLELDTDTNAVLTVFTADEQPLLASRSAAWFADAGDPDILAGTFAEPLAIAVVTSCRGTCVLMPAGLEGSGFLVRVSAEGDVPEHQLFIYGASYSDGNEPNDSAATATAIALTAGTGSDSGAIEVVGDTDWYQPETAVQRITFTPGANVPAELDLIATVYAEDDPETPLETLDRDNPEFGSPEAARFFVAVSASAGRAGPSAASLYSLEWNSSLVVIPVATGQSE
jgi:hypothetical protein